MDFRLVGVYFTYLMNLPDCFAGGCVVVWCGV